MSGPTIEILPEEETPTTIPAAPTSANSAVSATLSAKARGNKFVSVGNFPAAARAYTDALISLPRESYLAPTRLALLTNRALCYLTTKRWDLCRNDCDAALAIDSCNIKAWYRRARALHKLGELKKAIQDLKQLLAIDTKNGPAKKFARALIKEYNSNKKATASSSATANDRSAAATSASSSASSSSASTSSTSKSKPKSTKSKTKTTGLGLYDDKLDTNVSEHARLLERIRVAANRSPGAPLPTGGAAPGSIEKTFAALLTPEGFRQRIFPGLNIPEGFEAPQTLKEMLNDARYNDALEAMMPDVVAKANSVITNVKKKAAATGEVMDSATEEQLRPQILLEAFARTVTKIIGQTSASFMTQALRSVAPTASSDKEQADYDQLDDILVSACSRGDSAVQDDFMGGVEWTTTILDDLVRMERSGRLQPADPDDTTKSGKNISDAHMFAMVGNEECKDSYPALAELLENLEALPYEFNKKGFTSASGQINTLTEPGKSNCAVSKIKSSVGRRECVDGLTRGVHNGREVSCMYVVDGGGMTMRIRRSNTDHDSGNNNEITTTHLLNQDRLVVYHGQNSSNEILAAGAVDSVGEDQCGWFVTMYCQSKA